MVTELTEGEGDAINPSKRDFQEFIERQTTSWFFKYYNGLISSLI